MPLTGWGYASDVVRVLTVSIFVDVYGADVVPWFGGSKYPKSMSNVSDVSSFLKNMSFVSLACSYHTDRYLLCGLLVVRPHGCSCCSYLRIFYGHPIRFKCPRIAKIYGSNAHN